MPVSNNDVVRVKSFFEQGGNEALMVSYWSVEEVEEPMSNTNLAHAFHNEMQINSGVIDILHNTAKMTRTVIDILGSALEFGEWVEDIDGEGSADALPSFVAMSIKQVVGTRTTRAGYKRLPFIGENEATGNTPLVSTTVREQLEAFWGTSSTFVTPLGSSEGVVHMTPIVVGRTRVGTSLPPVYVEDLTRINFVTSAVVQKITSQNSRKV